MSAPVSRIFFLDERVAGLPHDGDAARARELLRQDLRALHVEDERLAGAAAPEQVEAEEEEEDIAPDDGSPVVHDTDPVRVAVEADAEVGAVGARGGSGRRIGLVGRVHVACVQALRCRSLAAQTPSFGEVGVGSCPL